MHEHIEEADLERVIPAFYARVRQDPLIGPVFDAAIDDWDHHLGKLVAFWSSVMRSTGRPSTLEKVSMTRSFSLIGIS